MWVDDITTLNIFGVIFWFTCFIWYRGVYYHTNNNRWCYYEDIAMVDNYTSWYNMYSVV